jgi:hypothetical protein
MGIRFGNVNTTAAMESKSVANAPTREKCNENPNIEI